MGYIIKKLYVASKEGEKGRRCLNVSQHNGGEFGPYWIAVNLVGLFIGIFLAEISSLAEPHRQSLVLTYGDVLSSQSG